MMISQQNDNEENLYEIISVRVPAKMVAMIETLSRLNLEAKSSMFTHDISKFLYGMVASESDENIIKFIENIINEIPENIHQNSFVDFLIESEIVSQKD